DALSKVSCTGRYLYTDDGTRFYIKGITYQTQGLVIPGLDNPLNQPSTFVDNLADSAGCAHDLPNLQKLGVNAIRAYEVDSSLNHNACMSALSGAGIYAMCIRLSLPPAHLLADDLGLQFEFDSMCVHSPSLAPRQAT
ncbi:Glucanosyltransferase-domain-containing protein, partial [Mycena epipterygia]